MENFNTIGDWLWLVMFAAFVLMMGSWLFCAVKNMAQYPDEWEDQEYWNDVNHKQMEDRQHES